MPRVVAVYELRCEGVYGVSAHVRCWFLTTSFARRTPRDDAVERRFIGAGEGGVATEPKFARALGLDNRTASSLLNG